MLLAAFTWEDLWRLALAVFLFAIGLSVAWFFVRLAETVDRLSSLIKGTEESVLPVVDKVGGSVDRLNVQLDKVDFYPFLNILNNILEKRLFRLQLIKNSVDQVHAEDADAFLLEGTRRIPHC